MTQHPLHCLGFEPIAALPPAANKTEPFSSKNGEPQKMRKGTRVRMADGTMGKVGYADPNLRIARVRTDDGRNVTVRRKTLTQVRP